MKIVVIAILACIGIWQGVVLYFISQVSDVIEAFQASPGGNMLIFLSIAQPISWILLASTLLAIYDVYKREVLLIMNSIILVLLAFSATASCHVLSLLAGYGKIFEMGVG